MPPLPVVDEYRHCDFNCLPPSFGSLLTGILSIFQVTPLIPVTISALFFVIYSIAIFALKVFCSALWIQNYFFGVSQHSIIVSKVKHAVDTVMHC